MSGSASGAIVLATIVIIDGLSAAAAIFNLSKERRLAMRLARMKATNTSRIAGVEPGQVVEIAGVARPMNDAALLESPLTGRPCFYFKLAIKESQGSSITHVATHTDAIDLLLDDSSGAVARIAMKDASVGLTQRAVEPADEARAIRLLAKLGIRKSTKDLLWFEEIIQPAADLYVLGRARAPAADEGQATPFRGGLRPKVIVEKPPDGELVVSVGNEDELATSLAADMKSAGKVGKAFMVVTLVLAAIAGWLVFSFLS